MRRLTAVLIVEDSHADALRARRHLQEAGVADGRIVHAETVDQAYEQLRASPFDLILLDLHVGPDETLDHIPRLRELNPSAAIIVLTGSTESELAEEALAHGAQDYLSKDDLTSHALRRAVRYAVHRHQFERETRQGLVAKRIVRRLLVDVTRLSGSSPSPRRELGRSLAAEVDAPTLPDQLAQFASLGAGELHLARAEADRFTFTGASGIEVTAEAAGPTCYVMLGYLEGAVARVTGKPALGAEMQCQSQGHPECQFVLKTRGG